MNTQEVPVPGYIGDINNEDRWCPVKMWSPVTNQMMVGQEPIKTMCLRRVRILISTNIRSFSPPLYCPVSCPAPPIPTWGRRTRHWWMWRRSGFILINYGRQQWLLTFQSIKMWFEMFPFQHLSNFYLQYSFSLTSLQEASYPLIMFLNRDDVPKSRQFPLLQRNLSSK